MQGELTTPGDVAPKPAGSGNRCGHDPQHPRFFSPPPEHGVRPPILCQWIERVRQFYDAPDTIPSLAHALFDRQVAADPAGDHQPRQMRSERREACCALLGSIMHYCDLPSLCVSVPQADGTLAPVTLRTLAERAGLGLRRAERAMRDIVTGGLLVPHRRAARREDGSYVGRAAIRVVPSCVFGLFGLEARLAHDRQRISQQRREAAGTRTGAARLRTAIGAALGATGGGARPPAPSAAAARIAAPPDLAPPHVAPTPAQPEPKHAPHIRALRAILAGAGHARDPQVGDTGQPGRGALTNQGP
ncbi:hypothetical protein [uncultured Lamprocystis sp.]|jgi:hypothetical protein|uniref:hypothetical protein n=1 Tax=uncultured Lamprocystis sp. TaxID=543132 RepID=UPI0025FFAD93|nr:hypothetical protein [uncultured Lamprocystis sp.]